MALESATYISDLVSTNPTSSDNLSQGDDHLRLLKSTIKATFPNVSGAVLPTHTELNYVDGVTSSIQTQLDAKAVLASANTFTGNQTINGNLTVSGAVSGVFPSGTKMLFQQTAAPTGWTKDTTHNDKALRVVSGAASSGGTVAFSTAFANRTVSGNVDNFTATGTVGGTALTVGQLPGHQHFIAAVDVVQTTPALSATNYVSRVRSDTNNSPNYTLTGTTVDATLGLTSATGSGETHTHTFTGTAHNHSFTTTLDIAVQYVDLIIATKN
jgi:hypothetical protein